MYTPVNPNFTIYKWVVRGSTIHGHISMMDMETTFYFRLKCYLQFPGNQADFRNIQSMFGAKRTRIIPKVTNMYEINKSVFPLRKHVHTIYCDILWL